MVNDQDRARAVAGNGGAGAVKPTEEKRIAVLSHAPIEDLNDGEKCNLFELVMRFRRWCHKHGYKPDVRTLPSDRPGHAERRLSTPIGSEHQ